MYLKDLNKDDLIKVTVEKGTFILKVLEKTDKGIFVFCENLPYKKEFFSFHEEPEEGYPFWEIIGKTSETFYKEMPFIDKLLYNFTKIKNWLDINIGKKSE